MNFRGMVAICVGCLGPRWPSMNTGRASATSGLLPVHFVPRPSPCGAITRPTRSVTRNSNRGSTLVNLVARYKTITDHTTQVTLITNCGTISRYLHRPATETCTSAFTRVSDPSSAPRVESTSARKPTCSKYCSIAPPPSYIPAITYYKIPYKIFVFQETSADARPHPGK